jgi:AcrR family transcriptional regulator
MSAAIDIDLPQPLQSRSLKTQQSFIEAGWAILREQSWETISITAIAQRAGRSVGVFYQRFSSKNDFLTVLLNRWIEENYVAMDMAPKAETPRALISWYLDETFQRIKVNRYLWRAALQRAIDDPASWDPFRKMGTRRREFLAEHLTILGERPLTDGERHRLDLAVQVFNSVINNALLNDPGPLRVDQAEFLPTLEGIFHTVAAFEFD